MKAAIAFDDRATHRRRPSVAGLRRSCAWPFSGTGGCDRCEPAATHAGRDGTPAAPQATLFAVVKRADGKIFAVVRSEPTDRVILVQLRDHVAGWQVAGIEDKQLGLELGGRKLTFALTK